MKLENMEIRTVVCQTDIGAVAQTVFCFGDLGIAKLGDHAAFLRVSDGMSAGPFYFKTLEGAAEAFDDVLAFLKTFPLGEEVAARKWVLSLMALHAKHLDKLCPSCTKAAIRQLKEEVRVWAKQAPHGRVQ